MADLTTRRFALAPAAVCLMLGSALLFASNVCRTAAGDDLPKRLPPVEAAAATGGMVERVTFGEPEDAPVFVAPGPVGRAVGDPTATPPGRTPLDPAFGSPVAETTILPEFGPGLLGPGQAGAAPWRLQLLPDGLIYRSYLAGVKEPRFASVWNHEETLGWLWDISLGGRVAALRYGTEDPLWPEGWELDAEGAALLRLAPEEDRDLVACDYRFGVPLTFGRGGFRTKFGYYHLSSHLGDEFLLRHRGFFRDNYVRDSLVLGQSLYLTDALRLYAEAAWAFYTSGRAKPWEFQFGLEFSPAAESGIYGAPFFAINGHLREEYDYSGNLVAQTGWQWRGASGHLFRIGMQYYAGHSDQWEFADQYEEKVGMGLWYDY
jgi:hypothetical protein